MKFETTNIEAFQEMIMYCIQRGIQFVSEFETELEIYVITFTGGF